ncbi:hypothetical protein DYB28_007351, partial [Aphanomyces astaci]
TGKDYSNPRIKDFVDVHRPDIDLMDRNLNPRMPWHDCHCKSDAGTTDLLNDELQMSALDENRASDDVAEGFACNCQIVRSLSMWSGGCRTEKSIQNAYIRLINDARHFVMQGDPLCQNLIANALVSRILRAHAANQPFRVMVVLPLLPAANINERSMSGDRDSEIAAVIEDVEWVPNVTLSTSSICGAAVGKFSHSFRMRLFEEHFGLESGGIGLSYREDPTAAPAWMALRQHAMANTNIYEAVFGCLPADSIRSFRDMGVDFVADSVQHPSGRFSQMQHRTSSQEAHDPVSTSDPPGSSSRPPLAPQDNHGDDGRVGVVAAAAVVAGGGGNDEVKSHESGAGKRAGNGRSMSKREQEAHSNAVFTNAMRAFRREQTVTKDLRLQLEDVRGHIVYFPLRFLEHEDLEPKLVPTELLQ